MRQLLLYLDTKNAVNSMSNQLRLELVTCKKVFTQEQQRREFTLLFLVNGRTVVNNSKSNQNRLGLVTCEKASTQVWHAEAHSGTTENFNVPS